MHKINQGSCSFRTLYKHIQQFLENLHCWQRTPALVEAQFGLRDCWQLPSLVSLPVQETSYAVPFPRPKIKTANASWTENPACWQATPASIILHPLPHTEPQTLFTHTSTRPSVREFPSTSLMSPLLQTTSKGKKKQKVILLVKITRSNKALES